MATQLTKTVCRKLNDKIFEKGQRNIMFYIIPGVHGHEDEIGVRLAGTRRLYKTTAVNVANAIIRWDCDAEYRRIEKRAREIKKSQNVHMGTARRIARQEEKDSK